MVGKNKTPNPIPSRYIHGAKTIDHFKQKTGTSTATYHTNMVIKNTTQIASFEDVGIKKSQAQRR